MTQGISWPYWKMLDMVRPWQAAALAAGINPDSMNHDNGRKFGPGKIKFELDSFSDTEELERFYRLWELAAGSRFDFGNQNVSLREFATALVANDWPGIPEPLRMMAKKRNSAPALTVPNPAPATREKLEPVQAAPAKRWTDDTLSELAAYRDKHGTTKAAEHFGISDARVRRLLPREKKQTATPFSGLGSRAR